MTIEEENSILFDLYAKGLISADTVLASLATYEHKQLFAAGSYAQRIVPPPMQEAKEQQTILLKTRWDYIQ